MSGYDDDLRFAHVLADAADDEERPVTTPDEPAEVIDLQPGEEPVEKPAPKP